MQWVAWGVRGEKNGSDLNFNLDVNVFLCSWPQGAFSAVTALCCVNEVDFIIAKAQALNNYNIKKGGGGGGVCEIFVFVL